MRTAQYRDAYGINVFLQSSRRDHFGRLTQAGVDHFHSRITKRACDDLRTTVMAVKPGFGDQYSYLSFRHVGASILANEHCEQTVWFYVWLYLCPGELYLTAGLESLDHMRKTVVIIKRDAGFINGVFV